MKLLPPIDRLRLERGAGHLHALGPRAIAEFLRDLADPLGGMPAVLARLADYQAGLTPAMMRATGGDRFPPRPLRAVPR